MIEGFFALIFGLMGAVWGLVVLASWGFLLLLFVPFALLWGWMLARILSRAGYSPWWALIGFIPPLLPLAVWIFAFSSWPAAARTVVLMPPERRY